ncbi:HlyD family secretion protein [Thermomonas sp. S9]|uniref:HlyD family secretion protein n=1 Tax=Thermomonas sp. S9 TaxID=2885203 RepID=UPI00216B56BC|nr:HlyD family secretion protein [Thermomonas sp. S9]
MVRPGDALPAQAPALLIADPARLDIGFTVAAGLRAQLAPGLRVALADGSAARVTAVGADLDPASQQVPVRARFEDPAGHVPGEALRGDPAAASPGRRAGDPGPGPAAGRRTPRGLRP